MELPPQCMYCMHVQLQSKNSPELQQRHCVTQNKTNQQNRAGAGPHLSLSLSSCLVRLQSCRVSSCWVTSSAHRQLTSSLSCSGALNIDGNIMLMLHTTHSAHRKKGQKPVEHSLTLSLTSKYSAGYIFKLN